MAFAYDTWGGAWGSAWGDSWGVQEQAVVQEQRPRGMPTWLKKQLVQAHLDEEKRKQFIQRLAVLLME